MFENKPSMALAIGAAFVVLAPTAPLAGTILFDRGRPIHIFPVHAAGKARKLEPLPTNPSDPFSCAESPGGLEYHGGPVIHRARQKSLWWGTSGFDPDVQPQVTKFFRRFGTTDEYQTITQYADSSGFVQRTRLTSFHRTDPTLPPSTVTDLDAQGEITDNFKNGALGVPNEDTLYYLFLPNGVTSTAFGAASCVDYCAYHSYFILDGMLIKYAVVPYPSCGGCQGLPQPGLSAAAASITILTTHETREAVSDPLLNAWWDSSTGQEADDKCAWQLFTDGDFQYQKEWSLAANGCVMKGICGP